MQIFIFFLNLNIFLTIFIHFILQIKINYLHLYQEKQPIKNKVMKTTDLKKGTKVMVPDTFFTKGFAGEIVSDGLIISRFGDICYEVRRFDDDYIYNIMPEGLSEIK